MPLLRPDPTFYPSPRMAMQAPPETLAWVAVINPRWEHDVDVKESDNRGSCVVVMPFGGIWDGYYGQIQSGFAEKIQSPLAAQAERSDCSGP